MTKEQRHDKHMAIVRRMMMDYFKFGKRDLALAMAQRLAELRAK